MRVLRCIARGYPGRSVTVCGTPAVWRWPGVGALCAEHRDERVFRFGFDLAGELINPPPEGAETMSMQELERRIRQETAQILKNPKLRNKDILEWTTGDPDVVDGEVCVRLEALGVNVVVNARLDRRPSPDG